jgi:hypothetical protein
VLTGLATDDFEISILRELRPLDWRSHSRKSRRDRPSGVFSAPCLMKRALTALLRERSPGRDGVERNMAMTDQPPTSLGKKTVSSAFGSNDRICET